LTARAAMWVDDGRIAEAEEDLQKATDLDVATLETIYLRTMLKFRQGKDDEARQLLRESADKIRGISEAAQKNLPPVALMLGIVAYFDGNHSVAIERFREFLNKFPNHDGAKRYLASAYLALGEWDAVIKLYRPNPTAEPPNDATPLSMMAEAYRAKGDFKSAQRYYEAAIRLAPNAAGLAVRLALARLEVGKAAQAVKDLNWLVETFPDLVEARVQLAQVYTRIGRHGDAKEQIIRSLEQHPTEAHILTVAGAVYMATDDLDLARKHSLQAADLDPELILPELNLARIEQKQNFP
jgi:tetratricopeptide (TPR) repeat protein